MALPSLWINPPQKAGSLMAATTGERLSIRVFWGDWFLQCLNFIFDSNLKCSVTVTLKKK